MRDEVNADLWRDNRRRWRISAALLALALLTILPLSHLRLSSTVQGILTDIGIISYVAGMIGLHWARRESCFLRQPEWKEPPKLWKCRD